MRFQPYLRPDSYAVGELEYPQYTVRSVYFDTHDMESYLDKIEGYKEKRKLRIRGYDTYNPGDKVVFEIKRKTGDRIYKNRVFLPFEKIPCIMPNSRSDMLNGDESFLKNDNFKKFMFHLTKKRMQPVILITYEREPYHGKLDSGVRVTFDKNIRSKFAPNLEELYDESFMNPLFRDYFILEIKYFTDFMPRWAKSIVAEYSLKREALSKFSLGLDAHRNAREQDASPAFKSFRVSGLSNFVFKRKYG